MCGEENLPGCVTGWAVGRQEERGGDICDTRARRMVTQVYWEGERRVLVLVGPGSELRGPGKSQRATSVIPPEASSLRSSYIRRHKTCESSTQPVSCLRATCTIRWLLTSCHTCVCLALSLFSCSVPCSAFGTGVMWPCHSYSLSQPWEPSYSLFHVLPIHLVLLTLPVFPLSLLVCSFKSVKIFLFRVIMGSCEQIPHTGFLSPQNLLW